MNSTTNDNIQIEQSPREVVREKKTLAKEFYEHNKELGKLRRKKAIKILAFRADGSATSDIGAVRLWEATEDGQKEIELHHITKGLEVYIQAVNSEIKIIQAEGYNSF